MKLFLLAIVCVFSISCSTEFEKPKNTIKIIQGPGEMQDKWKKGVLNKCHKESIHINLAIFESRKGNMTKEQVIATERFIFNSCLLHYNLYI